MTRSESRSTRFIQVCPFRMKSLSWQSLHLPFIFIANYNKWPLIHPLYSLIATKIAMIEWYTIKRICTYMILYRIFFAKPFCKFSNISILWNTPNSLSPWVLLSFWFLSFLAPPSTLLSWSLSLSLFFSNYFFIIFKGFYTTWRPSLKRY